MSYFLQQGFFVLKVRYLNKISGGLRKVRYSLQGMQVGKNTTLPRLKASWPHQVAIGDDCLLEHDTYFKYDGIWKPGPLIKIGDRVFIGTGCEFNITQGITVGNDSLIASGCRFIDHNHGMHQGELMRLQQGDEKAIHIGRNVWLGCNVVVLKGVIIGDGAVVAAGSVITKNIPANEVWGGVPAKKLKDR